MKKISCTVLAALVLFSLAACTQPKEQNAENENKQNKKQSETEEQIETKTALEAWELVQPEVTKWSASARIARIREASTASFQDQSGQAEGWEFVMELCTGSYYKDICMSGSTRSYFWYSTDIIGASAGVSADNASPFSSGLQSFTIDDVEVDSDEAVELARDASGQGTNADEEFDLDIQTTEGTSYWTVSRQCATRSGECENSDNYSQYIDITSGEVYQSKPSLSD